MENEVTLDAKTLHWEREAIEKLLLADVRERRAARRWRMFKTLVWMLLFAALIWVLFAQGLSTASTSVPHTAMVSIKGEIADKGESSAEYVLPALRSALEDSNSKALVLLIVGADPNLSHRADRILSQGWGPAFRGPAVDKCRSVLAL